jgi:hypothetical protein
LKIQHNVWLCALVGAGLAAALSGCGGGGGGDNPAQPVAVTLSGVAAEGAPMEQAAIRLVDATGTEVAKATADANGKYTLTVPLTAKAPFVMSAAKDDLVYYSPVAEAKTGTVNVTKLTNLIAAQLSPTGDPSALATQVAGGAASISATHLKEVVSAIEQALQPLLQNVGDTIDPISGTFDANGSGHDKVLMALDIAISPAGGSANITVTVKAVVADGDQAPAISFVSGSTPPSLPQQVATAQLPSSDTDAVVADFMSRLNSCYALPKAQRVNGTTAASVIAPVCRQIFTQDDPTLFKNNGGVVGANGAFSGLFRDGATGVTFTMPVIEFLGPNGRMLVSWKNTGTDGSISYNRVWVARENGALKAIGNGYQYPFTVRAWSEKRDFLNRPDLTYWATGFDVNVGNITSGGTPVFDHIVVTAPNGRTTTLVPNPGLSYVPIQGSNTSVLRLAGKFTTATTSGVPRRLSGITGGENLIWANNTSNVATDWTDTEIMGINNVGRWQADFYLATAPTVIAATQYYETMARPLTLAEMQVRQWAALTSTARSDVVSASSGTGNVALTAGDVVDLSVPGTPDDFWSVPTGVQGPTLVQAQGFVANAGTPAPRWNDNTGVSSLARKAVINCTAQTVSDAHCGTTAGTYSGNARVNLLQLFSYDARDMEWVTTMPIYLLSGIQ